MKVILIASGKGGTGKTSFTAGVSVALALEGRKVLAIDADIGLRNLDISLGMSERLVFSFLDVLNEVVSLEKAVVSHPRFSSLSVLTAPFSVNHLEFDKIKLSKLSEEAEKLGFDYLLIDASAGIGDSVEIFANIATQAVIVATPDNSSIRGAEVTARQLERLNIPRIRLVVNRIRPKLITSGMAYNIDDTMDITGLSLLGIIPEDIDVIRCGNCGHSIIDKKQKGAAAAYKNIAKRLEGHRLSLMKIK